MSHRELLVPTLSWLKVFFAFIDLSSVEKYLVLSENLSSCTFSRMDLDSANMPRTAVKQGLYPQVRGMEQESAQ